MQNTAYRERERDREAAVPPSANCKRRTYISYQYMALIS